MHRWEVTTPSPSVWGLRTGSEGELLSFQPATPWAVKRKRGWKILRTCHFGEASLKIGKQSHFKPTYFPESSEKPNVCPALWFILTFPATVGYWESADGYGNRPDSNNQERTFSKCSCCIFPALSTECSQSYWIFTLTPWGLCIIVLHLTTGETEPLRITKSIQLRIDALCTEELLLVTFLLSSLFFFSSMCQNVHSSLMQFIVCGF